MYPGIVFLATGMVLARCPAGLGAAGIEKPCGEFMLYGNSGILNPTGLGSRSRLMAEGREHSIRKDLVVENNSNRPPKK
jgi:hypothetical protein